MLSFITILVTLGVIVLLLNRKVKMPYAMLAGSTVLFLLSGPELPKLAAAMKGTVTGHSTWEIMIALYFVMCLEFQLRTSGIIDGLMTAARNLLRSDRVLLAMMPAFLGFLPSLGGAIFSAPLVENASKSYQLLPETKTAINYWFRHVLEYTSPIFSGILLASQISGIALGSLITNMAWLSALAIVLGWLFLIMPIKAGENPTPPVATDSGSSNRFLLLAVGPILLNIAFIVFGHWPASLSMMVVVGIMIFVIRQKPPQITSMLRHALDGKLLWGVASIMFFQHVLRQSGIVSEVALILKDMAIPPTVVIGVIAFTGGLLTGTSQGFVAITFPFIDAFSHADLTLAMIAFALGTAGQMLSPAHLCLLVTLDYFKADFGKSLRPVLAMNIIMIVAAYAMSM